MSWAGATGTRGPIKPLVYIASPYRLGDQAINARFQCQVFEEFMNDGIVLPYPPLWNHFQHTLFPRAEADWIEHDNAVLVRCNALIRLDSTYAPMGYHQHKSNGSDAEEALARQCSIPVFYNKQDLYQWAQK